MTNEEFKKWYGMSPERCKRLMIDVADMITSECREVIAHADYYKNPLDYLDADQLEKMYGAGCLEKDDEDDDGFVKIFNVRAKATAEWMFKRLISLHTTHGGHTDAVEACRLMGLNWRE